MPTFNTALDRLQLSGIRRITALAKETPGCILLTLGEPDGNTSEAVKAEVPAALAANMTHYPPNNGYDFLRQAISARMAGDGLAYSADEVIVTCGATEALFTALSTMMNPGDEVIIPTPAFGLYESIVTMNRGVPVFMDTRATDFQITPELLTGHITPRTKAIVLTSPNNPTGCILDAASLDAVAQAVQDHDLFVICDDVYAHLAYGEEGAGAQAGSRAEGEAALGENRGTSGSTAQANFAVAPGFAARFPHLRQRVVVCDSFSKPYAMTGWRLGWLAGSAQFVAQASKVHQYMVSSVPAFVQSAAARALGEDVRPVRETYRARRDLVVRRLREMGLDLVEPQGAFYAFPNIERFGLSSEEFCTRCIKEVGVALVPGSCFAAEGHVRLSYCCSDENLAEGLNRLERFVSSL